MSRPAFTVQGYSVTAEQRDAALAVMVGTFNRVEVVACLMLVGTPWKEGLVYIADRAADRLLQTERLAGRIRVARGKGRGMWERVA